MMATVNLFGDLALDNTVKATNDKLTALTASKDSAIGAGQKGVVSLAVRRDEDTASTTDGNLTTLAVDEEGRLKTSNKTGSFAAVTGSVNTVGATVAVDVRRASNVVLHVKNIGATTIAAGQFAFEGSLDSTDGTNGTWFGIQAIRSNSNTIETTTATISPAMATNVGAPYSWEASVNAYQYMRVRCSTAVTAGGNALWTILRGSYATEPIPAAQASATQAVSGTVTATPGTSAVYSLATVATTNAAFVKASAGTLYELTISNPTATAAYVKLYNKTTAPTVGTDVPVLTIPVPPTGTNSGLVNLVFGTSGKRFLTGIAIAVTAAAPATDTGVAVAGVQIHGTYI